MLSNETKQRQPFTITNVNPRFDYKNSKIQRDDFTIKMGKAITAVFLVGSLIPFSLSYFAESKIVNRDFEGYNLIEKTQIDTGYYLEFGDNRRYELSYSELETADISHDKSDYYGIKLDESNNVMVKTQYDSSFKRNMALLGLCCAVLGIGSGVATLTYKENKALNYTRRRRYR